MHAIIQAKGFFFMQVCQYAELKIFQYQIGKNQNKKVIIYRQARICAEGCKKEHITHIF